MIAALYVETGGCYFGVPGVDPWDRERDARGYAGPHAVVAHPPCERWGAFWYGGLYHHKNGTRKKLGDDGGCFSAALAAVRAFGGVIEHPRGSRAWAHFGIARPPRAGGWIQTGWRAWTCEVYQGRYGHKALKPTWLYWDGAGKPPELAWGKPDGVFAPVSARSFRSKGQRDAAVAAGWKHAPRLSTKERLVTPLPFRDLLIGLARRASLGRFA